MAFATILLLAAVALIASGPELLGRLARRARTYIAARIRRKCARSPDPPPG
ncbi:MAG TPA: hypothetical protein VFT99_19705 [Roseiflexaceae bacterium]|nr:hypothetical protein [Roseiflexaceae bacterium]